MFDLATHGTSVRREAIAGTTTFLTAAYIIFVHPAILSGAGMDAAAVAGVTCLISAAGTLLMGLWARAPLMMAPGMGLNAFFAITLCGELGLPWQTALGVVFISGLLFLALTFAGVRERVLASIPNGVRVGTSVGIGLFLAFIGFRNLGLVVDHPVTLVTLAPLTKPVIVGLIGLALTAGLAARNTPGGLLIGIAVTTAAAIALGISPPPKGAWAGFPDLGAVAFQLDIGAALTPALLAPIFAFMYVDLFDSLGTLFAVCKQAGYVDEDGNIPGIGRMLTADALATAAGAVLGTSTTTTYIESAAGVGAGGRTGLTSVFTAGWFLLALPLAPLVGAVPALATAPALIVVGASMLGGIRDLRISATPGDLADTLPAFVTLLLMPLTYSISTGLMFGFLAHVAVQVAIGKGREISWVLWLIAGLSGVNLAT